MKRKLKVGDRVTCAVLHCEVSGQSGEITGTSKMNRGRLSYMVRFDVKNGFSREWPFVRHELQPEK